MARFKNPLECGHILKSTGENLGAGMLTEGSQQIDAIFGLGAGVAEMLLQSHQGFIELLPAVPVDWIDGSFRGMCARGGFVVSASCKRGRLTGAEIKAQMDGACRIKARGLLRVKGSGNTWEAADGMAEWEARQGETYVLEFSGEEIAGREYQI